MEAIFVEPLCQYIIANAPEYRCHPQVEPVASPHPAAGWKVRVENGSAICATVFRQPQAEPDQVEYAGWKIRVASAKRRTSVSGVQGPHDLEMFHANGRPGLIARIRSATSSKAVKAHHYLIVADQHFRSVDARGGQSGSCW